MGHKPNRRCRVCGKEYYACNDCAAKHRATYGLESWRAIADSATHYQIYILLVEYNRKTMPVDEIRQQMERLDLSDLESFLPQYQERIREILATGSTALEEATDTDAVKRKARASRNTKRAAPEDAPIELLLEATGE